MGIWFGAMLADAVLLLHAAFVVFVVAGAALVPRWPRVAWLHLPAVAWGVTVEVTGWICPLTPLEDHLRRMAGQSGYAGDFVGHWVQALLYPAGLTRPMQWTMAALLLVVNVAAYAALWRRRAVAARRASASRNGSARSAPAPTRSSR